MKQLWRRGAAGREAGFVFNMNKELCRIKHVSVVLKTKVTKLEVADFRDSFLSF